MKNKEQMKCALGVCTPKKIVIDKNLKINVCKICGKVLEKDKWVRRHIAQNPNTPKKVLKQLSKDEKGGIRWRVAQNKNTPAEVLERLSKDEDWYVRYCVAENKNTPIEILKRLSKDEDEYVRRVVAERLKLN